MQDQYAGDIGDYVKFALLGTLARGRRLGVAWYLHRDEPHKDDGKFTGYLARPERYASLDAALYRKLARVVRTGRSVRALQAEAVVTAEFHDELLDTAPLHWRQRSEWRAAWFAAALEKLGHAEIVFADPDNGLTDNDPRRRGRKQLDKSIPLAEAQAWARGRTAVIYHHNTRFPGGHDAEVDHWLAQLGGNAMAVRANRYSCRTFFILNPDGETGARARAFCDRWRGERVFLHGA